MHEESSAGISSPPLPRTALDWLKVFGPGAVVASLTIGTGELIFSTRGGALFGYRILFVFVAISFLKWGLVLASSRHMLLTGVHPYERMQDLPGPRGWLPLMLLMMCSVCMPIWLSFHSGVLGNLTSWITGTRAAFNGGMDYVWGAAILIGVLILAASGGYSLLERVQMLIVTALVFCAGITLVLYNPDWLALLFGVVPQPLSYPDWLPAKYPEIAKHSVWIETTRYVGVIGGAGFDYMAYTSWLREKHWGALPGRPSEAELAEIAADPNHRVRKWLKAPLIDSTISFGLIIAFSAVFVASGAMILRPHEVVPDEDNLLNLQSQFVTRIHSLLLPLYVTGAFLTMIGTLYGTIEIACSIADEIVRSFAREWDAARARRLKLAVVCWCAPIALTILGWLFVRQASFDEAPQTAVAQATLVDQPAADSRESAASTAPVTQLRKPRLLLALLTPVNLFTGVLACGLICFLNIWMDWRYLPSPLRMPIWLLLLNVLSGLVFLALGMKGYWDNHKENGTFFEQRWFAIVGLIGTMIAGVIVAAWVSRRSPAMNKSPNNSS
jgi:Mn2+/Fe2+ NRAMP family transporter